MYEDYYVSSYLLQLVACEVKGFSLVENDERSSIFTELGDSLLVFIVILIYKHLRVL